jgi:hypothetical protein
MAATNKRKKVTIFPIVRAANDAGPEPYTILDRLVGACRDDLAALRIALAYKHGWTVNRDGQLQAGKCYKPNEISRSLIDYDVVILLNYELWPLLDAQQKEELIFHELQHVAVEEDGNGDEKRDEKGRLVIRIRHHDIDEFRAVRARYGEENLGSAAATILARAREPLLAGTEKEAKDA